jgi:DNA-binding NarL/FixJ family response regulator
MIRVFLADAQGPSRAALGLMLKDLDMLVVGEAADWQATLDDAGATQPHMVVVDWNLIPAGSTTALADLRTSCSTPVTIVLISHLDARQQAALYADADIFISKRETPDRVADHLRSAAEESRSG